METLRLGIDGMTCASCVGRVERVLAAQEGVHGARVNLATEIAEVDIDADVDVVGLGAALEGAGYPLRRDRLQFDVEGMTCASCVGRVENSLRGVAGVHDVAVNLATETATVDIGEGLVTATEIEEAIAKSGYVARLHSARTDQAAPRDRKAEEARSVLHRFLLAALLTLPVFTLEMGGHLIPALHHWVAHTITPAIWDPVQLALTLAVLALPGRFFFSKGFASLFRGAPDMNALVALGAGSAFCYSALVVVWPNAFPVHARNVYFEAAAVIVTLVLMGRYFEARAKGRTGAAIRSLIDMQEKTARVQRGSDVLEVPIDQVRVGDHIILRPAERVPVDGIIVSGEGDLDEAMISGEPMPVAKAAGDRVIAGTVNGGGPLTFEASAVGADTMLAQIIRMVEEAQGAKLPIQSLVDRVTVYFVPAVIAVALVTVVIWLLVGPEPVVSNALVAGVCVLIIACPCAMGLATPTSIMVGTGRAAQLGVLFRRGDALQTLSSVNAIAFDKTGTLTKGRPVVADIIALDDTIPVDQMLAEVAAVEQSSEHPIARALVDYATARGLELPDVDKMKVVPGQGVRAQLGGIALWVGNARLMVRAGGDMGDFDAAQKALSAQACTPIFVLRDGRPALAIGVSDEIKPTAPHVIEALKARGVATIMVSGDTPASARKVAQVLGIDDVEAEVLPKGKAEIVERLRARFGSVAFVGDGINDAPALGAADVGLAMGTGTDVAIEAADVVLASGDPSLVLLAKRVSDKTMRNIRQNLFWAFAYNVALIPVAAGALYPIFGLQLSPMLGAGAMAMSSVFVVSNALRLRAIT